MERAGTGLVWSHCDSRELTDLRGLPWGQRSKARFALQEAGRRNGPEKEKECSAEAP